MLSLVGRVMCVLRWCELSITLGSLFSDGWACVPIVLVVWPEAFQYWRLQIVGWGQFLVPIWRPLGELRLINTSWGLYYLCSSHYRELQPIPIYPGGHIRPLGRSVPGSCGSTTLCRVSVHVRPCVHPPGVQSLFPSALWSSCTLALLTLRDKCSGVSSS